MAVSDRIAVMNGGVIQQIGTPQNLYQRPANLFVATFIGHTNVIDGEIKMEGKDAYLLFPDGYRVKLNTIKEEEKKDQKAKCSIRPEELYIDKNSKEGLHAVVDDAVFLGLNTHYFVHFDNGDKVEIVQESQIDSIIPKGSDVYLSVKTEKINVFNEDGSRNLIKGVVNDLDLLGKE